jgi:hypothetical protein
MGSLHHLPNRATQEFFGPRPAPTPALFRQALIELASHDACLLAAVELEMIGDTDAVPENLSFIIEDVGRAAVFEDVRSFHGLSPQDFEVSRVLCEQRVRERLE